MNYQFPAGCSYPPSLRRKRGPQVDYWEDLTLDLARTGSGVEFGLTIGFDRKPLTAIVVYELAHPGGIGGIPFGIRVHGQRWEGWREIRLGLGESIDEQL